MAPSSCMTVQGTGDDAGADDSSYNHINNITGTDDGENIQSNDDSNVINNVNNLRAQLAHCPCWQV